MIDKYNDIVYYITIKKKERGNKMSKKTMKEKYPVEWVERAIKGMLPHTKLGDKQRGHVFVYAGDQHPHAAQKPVELKVKG